MPGLCALKNSNFREFAVSIVFILADCERCGQVDRNRLVFLSFQTVPVFAAVCRFKNFYVLAVDCKPCMCPGNVVAGDVNVFASTCELQHNTGTITCHNCTAGHSGDRCEACAQDFYGVPTDPTVSPPLFALFCLQNICAQLGISLAVVSCTACCSCRATAGDACRACATAERTRATARQVTVSTVGRTRRARSATCAGPLTSVTSPSLRAKVGEATKCCRILYSCSIYACGEPPAKSRDFAPGLAIG